MSSKMQVSGRNLLNRFAGVMDLSRNLAPLCIHSRVGLSEMAATLLNMSVNILIPALVYPKISKKRGPL